VGAFLYTPGQGLGGPERGGGGRGGPPAALYLWTYGSSVFAHAAFFGLPGSAVVGGALMGLVAVPFAGTVLRSALRSARHRRTRAVRPPARAAGR
jgi:hypothetical protein